MSVHGGPEWIERDAFDAGDAQAFVDAGYAVALVKPRIDRLWASRSARRWRATVVSRRRRSDRWASTR